MPFADADTASRLGLDAGGTPMTMWQLSFRVPMAEARAICTTRATLKAEALLRCDSWHAPIPALLRQTSLDDISGYPVWDREVPDAVVFRGHPRSSVTLLGDAAHPMSPFKVFLTWA